MSKEIEIDQLNVLLAEAGLDPLGRETLSQFEAYLSLFICWNQRINLSSIRSEGDIRSRHLVESIVVANYLPLRIVTLLDFGSGAGLPGIPIALCRPEIAVTLAESQNKKAAFLEEALRTLGIHAKVHAQRAETLRTVFDCVVLRAVDHMAKAVAAAAPLVAPMGWLAPLTTDVDLPRLQEAAGHQFQWAEPIHLPGSEFRLLALGQRVKPSA